MTETGIWQGRFQYIHLGHTHVFDTELNKFKNKIIAIVNPNPSIPSKNFERFGTAQNPFSYFERMFLWKKYADSVGVNVTIVPCWHARYIIALENDFLPPRSTRSWIIPLSQDDSEEEKSKDLKQLGETVYDADYMAEPIEYRGISATMIRRCFKSNNYEYRKYIPQSICNDTENFALESDEHIYYSVPIIDDLIDIKSLQTAINLAKQNKNNYILFVVTVHVSNGELVWKHESSLPWWFKNAKPGYKTFYKKAQLINNLMHSSNVSNYVIVPLFVMNENIDTLREYNYAFLPRIENIRWMINPQNIKMYKNNFLLYLDNIDAENNIVHTKNNIQISDELMLFETEHPSYICKEPIKFNSNVQLDVFQKWFDRKFDSKESEIENRILAGYDQYLEKQKKERLEKLRLEIQMRIDFLFYSDVEENVISKLKQTVIEKLDEL